MLGLSVYIMPRESPGRTCTHILDRTKSLIMLKESTEWLIVLSHKTKYS